MVMTYRNTRTLFESLDLMLEATIKEHMNHEQRDRQLSVIRSMIDEWLRRFHQYTSPEDREAQAVATLETVYQLCIWHLDHETHKSVKDRLNLARRIIAQYYRRLDAHFHKVDVRVALERRIEAFDSMPFSDDTDELPVDDEQAAESPAPDDISIEDYPF